MGFDDLDRLGSRERFGDRGLHGFLKQNLPLALVAFIPVEVNESQDQTDTTCQTQGGDEDIAIVHPPNLARLCNYVKSWLEWNYQLSLTYPRAPWNGGIEL